MDDDDDNEDDEADDDNKVYIRIQFLSFCFMANTTDLQVSTEKKNSGGPLKQDVFPARYHSYSLTHSIRAFTLTADSANHDIYDCGVIWPSVLRHR